MTFYIQKFQSAAFRSTLLYGGELNPPLALETARAPYGAEVVDAVLSDFTDGVVTSAMALPGNCFAIVREASYVLFEMGIDNVITIGNVVANGKDQFFIDQAKVVNDISIGFEPSKPANAHAWLTLDTGQILDPTILPSWAYHDEGRVTELNDAIYLSGQPCGAQFTHEPFLTGFVYHLQVVTHPIAYESFAKYSEWLEHSSIFKRNIARKREA